MFACWYLMQLPSRPVCPLAQAGSVAAVVIENVRNDCLVPGDVLLPNP
jgi:hypothetical protein